MVIVDTDRCCYCGGCVSVCPSGALFLAETRLMVDETCTDCENCVFACPVGALSLAGRMPARPQSIKRKYDVVIVGAGPGGSIAAEACARAGLSTLLLEKRQEIGSPVRCAEGVGHDQLVAFLEPDPIWIAADIDKLEIATQVNGSTRTWRADGGHGFILERRIFDQVLAENAAKAGAHIHVKTPVTGVILENGRVCGVKITSGDWNGARTGAEIEAQVVIAADGVEAQVGRCAGLDMQLPLNDTMTCAQYLLAGIDIDPTCTYYTISTEFAPGGYAWVFPKGEGKANVGLGLQANLPCDANALELLNRFIEAQPHLACGCPVTLITGNVPVALPPAQIVGDGIMLIGDAARQVDPLTGGGIVNAMTAGRIAAQVACEAIAAHDVSASRLTHYTDEWRKVRGNKMERNYRLRDKFPPSERANERFVHAFMLAAK